MYILVACEESQAVTIAFRERGHEAFSCDILPCSGGHPEWHIQDDVLKYINGKQHSFDFFFVTQDGHFHDMPFKWDLIIGFPPCTYLTCTGNSWFNVSRYGDMAIKRAELREASIRFFMSLANADCPRVVLENPVGVMSTLWRKPDQIVHPYFFGDPFEKRTCLWVKGVPPLIPTCVCVPPERLFFASGKSMPAWYADAWKLPKNERSRFRSKTFPGIARAMADQWG